MQEREPQNHEFCPAPSSSHLYFVLLKKFCLFFHVDRNPELTDHFIITCLTEVEMMNISVFFGKEIPCMIEHDSSFPDDSFFYYDFLSAHIADNCLQLSVFPVSSHPVLTFRFLYLLPVSIHCLYIIAEIYVSLSGNGWQSAEPHDQRIFCRITVIPPAHGLTCETIGFVKTDCRFVTGTDFKNNIRYGIF